MRVLMAVLVALAVSVPCSGTPIGDCGSESVGGRSDVIFCEPFESATWYTDEGFTDTDSNPADATDVSSTQIVTTGCVSGDCLKVNMLTGQTQSLSVKWHPADAGLSPDSLYLRYYIKLAADWSPDMCDTPGHVAGAGGKFPGLSDERVSSDPSGQCGNGGDPGDGINCWSMRADYRNCDSACDTKPTALTRFGSYLYFYGQEGSTGSAGLWDNDSWGQSTDGGGTCASNPSNVFCGTSDGGVFLNDQWYCVEMFVKMNTPDIADGVIKGWIDGVQYYDKRNMIFRLTGHDNLHVRTVWLNVYKGGVYGNCNDTSIYLDQLVVATGSEIGTFLASSGDVTDPGTTTDLRMEPGR